jgi:hypothetical protein
MALRDVFARMGQRRQERRYDNANPLQGPAPMSGEQTANRAALDARTGGAAQQYAQDRRSLSGVLAGYGDIAAGQGPNPAADMLRAATDRNVAQTIAAMGSVRGGNLAANSMAAATAGAGMQQQAAQQAAAMQSQQQLDAMAAQGNLASTLAGMSNAREMGMLGMGQDALQFQTGQGQAWEIEAARLRAEADNARKNRIMQGLQMGATIGGDVLGGVLSDERMKENVGPATSLASRLAAFEEADDSAAETFAGLDDVEWDYTDEGKKRGGGEGRHVGVMAQQLERSSKRGREAVQEVDGAKRIDGARGLSLALAAGASHERRLRALEKGAA